MYLLTVTTQVDEYNHRLDCAETETFVYEDLKDCEIKLAQIIVDYIHGYYQKRKIYILERLLNQLKLTIPYFSIVPLNEEEKYLMSFKDVFHSSDEEESEDDKKKSDDDKEENSDDEEEQIQRELTKRVKLGTHASLQYDTSIPLDKFPSKEIHNVLCQGKHVNYAFTYTIKELTVMPPEKNMYKGYSYGS
jgi:hypothetical protein